MKAHEIVKRIEDFRSELEELPIGDFPEETLKNTYLMICFIIRFALIQAIGVKETCRVKKLAKYIDDSTDPHNGAKPWGNKYPSHEDLVGSREFKCTVCAVGILFGPASKLTRREID